jgi:hypothetical protein
MFFYREVKLLCNFSYDSGEISYWLCKFINNIGRHNPVQDTNKFALITYSNLHNKVLKFFLIINNDIINNINIILKLK